MHRTIKSILLFTAVVMGLILFGITTQAADEDRTISGTISLPNNEVAPGFGMKLKVICKEYNGSRQVEKYITIPDGANFIPYSLVVPTELATKQCTISYFFPQGSGKYYGTGFYTLTRTAMAVEYATPICLADGNPSSINLEILYNLFLESKHPYNQNDYSDYEYQADANYSAMQITFSSNTEFAKGDWLYIYDANKDCIGEYTKNELAGKTITVPGNMFSMGLDGYYGGYYGFAVINIVGIRPPSTPNIYIKNFRFIHQFSDKYSTWYEGVNYLRTLNDIHLTFWLESKETTDIDVKMIVGLYDVNNRLVATDIVNKKVYSNHTTDIAQLNDTNCIFKKYGLPMDAYGLQMKVMLWSDVQNAKPITRAYKFPQDDIAFRPYRGVLMGTNKLNMTNMSLAANQIVVNIVREPRYDGKFYYDSGRGLTVINTNGEDYSKYLGYCIGFDIDENSNLLFMKNIDEKNTEVIIDAKDVTSVSKYELRYWKNKETDSEPTIIYLDQYNCIAFRNGQKINTFDMESLVPQSGKIRLLNNDDDDSFEYIFVTEN